MASSGSALQRLLSASATLADALPEVAAELAKLHEEISSLEHDKVGIRLSWFVTLWATPVVLPVVPEYCTPATAVLLLWLAIFVFFEQKTLQQQVVVLQSRCEEQQQELELMRRSESPSASDAIVRGHMC